MGRVTRRFNLSEGVPEIVKSLIYPVPLNDANRLEDIFKQRGDKIGTFLIEPMMGNCCSITATREYMQAARELCDRYGVLMIIDEVKTGFRVAKGEFRNCLGSRQISALSPKPSLMAIRSRWLRVNENLCLR